jgi:hypothetical protein
MGVAGQGSEVDFSQRGLGRRRFPDTSFLRLADGDCEAMQLMYPDEMPPVIQGRECRESRLMAVVIWVLILGLLVGVPTFIWSQSNVPWWVTLILAVYSGLMIRWGLSTVLRTFFRSNWVLQIAPFGLWINIRYFMNCFFDRARTVIYLPYDEIANVHERVVERSDDDGETKSTWKERSLDIHLKEPVSEEVRAEIAEERRRKQTNKYLFGQIKSSSRYGHVPVLAAEDDVLRIMWRGKGTYIVPALATVLKELESHVAVGEVFKRNLSDSEKLSPEQLDQAIVDLVRGGHSMEAMKLLTKHRGMTLTQANEFVKHLEERLD